MPFQNGVVTLRFHLLCWHGFSSFWVRYGFCCCFLYWCALLILARVPVVLYTVMVWDMHTNNAEMHVVVFKLVFVFTHERKSTSFCVLQLLPMGGTWFDNSILHEVRDVADHVGKPGWSACVAQVLRFSSDMGSHCLVYRFILGHSGWQAIFDQRVLLDV